MFILANKVFSNSGNFPVVLINSNNNSGVSLYAAALIKEDFLIPALIKEDFLIPRV